MSEFEKNPISETVAPDLENKTQTAPLPEKASYEVSLTDSPATSSPDQMLPYSGGWQFGKPDLQETPVAPQPVYSVSGTESREKTESENKKKEKKPLSVGKAVFICITVSLIFSLLLAGGGYYYLQQALQGGQVILQQSNPPLSSDGPAAAMDVAAVAKIASPSVVEITTEQLVTGSFMQQYVQEGAGSGVIISSDGYIVTNNHVISGATTVTVRTTDGKEYNAVLVGTDVQTDIAVIKIEAENLTAAVFGNSDNLQVGDPCVAIGNPLGRLGGTVTDGIISALDRQVTIDQVTMQLLQTDAAVNPGNSGGGLFDRNGCLIAVVNAKSSGSDVEGLGFAIPVSIARPVIADLIEHGYVKGRPYMGIAPVDINDSSTARYYGVSEFGVYILKVLPDGPASQTDLRSGDRIVSIDGVEISSTADLTSFLSRCSVGQTIEIEVARAFGNEKISLTLAESVPEES